MNIIAANNKQIIDEYLESRDSEKLEELYIKNKDCLYELPSEVLIDLYSSGYDVKKTFSDKARIEDYAVSDEILCFLASNGDEYAKNYLVEKNIGFVKRVIKQLKNKGRYNSGYDLDDMIQSGYMGLYSAIKDFKIEKKIPFHMFARHVILRYMNSLITRSNNNKLKSLNGSFSFQTKVSPDSTVTFEDMLRSESYSPTDQLIKKEMFYEFWDQLSETEQNVLWYFSESYTYEEIGEILFKDTHDTVKKQIKAVDNTIQRINKKRDIHFK